MATREINKAALARAQRDLSTYRRFLPSLDLKRQQLMVERARARDRLSELREADAAATEAAGTQLPMLADTEIDLSGLVKLRAVDLSSQNVVGARLPTVRKVDVSVAPYSALARPHWVDAAVALLTDAIRRKVEIEVAEARLARLQAAVKTVTQRVNLFEKVLIPRTEADIKRIRIVLGDAETAAVVRAKIAKRQHAALLDGAAP